MQAVFVISLVTMLIAIMGSMISSGTAAAAKLTADRIVETREFFENMAKVVINDITRQHLHANPDNFANIPDYIRGMPQLSQLSSGRVADLATDAWGRPVNGRIFTSYESLQTAGPIKVSVPVTGIAFVSAGPDGVMQTTLPNVTQLSQIIGIAAPVGSDDIVITFNNRGAQQEQFASMQASLRRIGSAAVKALQSDVTKFRQDKLEAYQAAIQAGDDVSISLINITNEPCNKAGVPCFMALDNSTSGIANRRKIGIDGDFDSLQRNVGGGRMEVIATQPARLADPMILKLQNASGSPTPWGHPKRSDFNYQIEVTAVE